MTFLNKRLIFFRSLKEPFGRNSVNISGCRAFCLFETVPSCEKLNIFQGINCIHSAFGNLKHSSSNPQAKLKIEDNSGSIFAYSAPRLENNCGLSSHPSLFPPPPLISIIQTHYLGRQWWAKSREKKNR